MINKYFTMKKVTIYTKPTCPYCVKAKELFASLDVTFEEIDVIDHPDKREEAIAKYNWMTVPMIIVGDEFLGGYDDVALLHEKGELLPKLQG